MDANTSCTSRGTRVPPTASAKWNRVSRTLRVSSTQPSEPPVSQNYVDNNLINLYCEDHEETNEDPNVPRAPENPSLLSSFKTHVAVVIW